MLQTDPKLEYCIKVEIEEDGDEYHAYCHEIKGFHISGQTLDETIENTKEAIIAYLSSLKKHNEPVPDKLIRKHKEPHPPITYQYCFAQEKGTFIQP